MCSVGWPFLLQFKEFSECFCPQFTVLNGTRKGGMIVVIDFAIHIITSSHDHHSFWHIAPALKPLTFCKKFCSCTFCSVLYKSCFVFDNARSFAHMTKLNKVRGYAINGSGRSRPCLKGHKLILNGH